jgi:hypothetical protein
MKMQQTKSYWLVVAVAGVVGAIVASACTVTTSSDDSSGGTGTIAGTGGTSIAGTTSTGGGGTTATGGSSGSTSIGGTTSTGGSGGAAATTTFQCDPADGNPVGTPSSCAATAGNGCSECIAGTAGKMGCCAQFSACFATSPGNQCGYGGPNGDGKGEFVCVQACIQAATSDGGVLDDTTIGTCAGNCATPKDSMNQSCEQHVGQQTSDLVDCVNTNCQAECFGG